MHGPIYKVDDKHSYGADYAKDIKKTEMHGPIYKDANYKHSYGADYSIETKKQEMHGPIYRAERKHKYGKEHTAISKGIEVKKEKVHDVGMRHHFKHPIDKPHARDLGRNKTPTFEVTESHHYRESNTHKSDLSEMHGPIYKQAPVKHSYTGGYIGTRASSAEKEQLEKQKALVGKFFKQEAKTRSKSVDTRVEKKTETFTSTQSSSQQVTMVQGRETQIMEAKQAGQERKQEALRRREEFVSSQTTTQVDGKILSTQEIRDINAKREELIRQEVLKIQSESKMMMERYMLECKRRNDQLEQEKELRIEEERRKREGQKRGFKKAGSIAETRTS